MIKLGASMDGYHIIIATDDGGMHMAYEPSLEKVKGFLTMIESTEAVMAYQIIKGVIVEDTFEEWMDEEAE